MLNDLTGLAKDSPTLPTMVKAVSVLLLALELVSPGNQAPAELSLQTNVSLTVSSEPETLDKLLEGRFASLSPYFEGLTAQDLRFVSGNELVANAEHKHKTLMQVFTATKLVPYLRAAPFSLEDDQIEDHGEFAFPDEPEQHHSFLLDLRGKLVSSLQKGVSKIPIDKWLSWVNLEPQKFQKIDFSKNGLLNLDLAYVAAIVDKYGSDDCIVDLSSNLIGRNSYNSPDSFPPDLPALLMKKRTVIITSTPLALSSVISQLDSSALTHLIWIDLKTVLTKTAPWHRIFPQQENKILSVHKKFYYIIEE